MGSHKLIYNLATGKWLLQVGEDVWTLRSTSDALGIAGFLQVHVVDKSSSDYLVIAKGLAQITDINDFECQIELTPHTSPEQKTSVTVYPEKVNFGILDCYQGFHPDLWVETDASMTAENIQTLGLKFFLPKIKDHENKAVDFFVGNKKVSSLDLIRGDSYEVWIDMPDDGHILKDIQIKCDYKEPNATDERNLGMIFVEYNVNLTEWKPAGNLL